MLHIELREEPVESSASSLTDHELATRLSGECYPPLEEDSIAPTGRTRGEAGGSSWARVRIPGRYPLGHR